LHSRVALVVALIFVTSLVLGACGDNTATPATNTLPTATPLATIAQPGNAFATTAAATTAAATTAAATTAAATTAAATTAAATTAAATTAAATTAAATTAAATTAAAAGKPGGTLNIALAQEPDQLDPAKTVLGASNSVNSEIYDRLVYIGADGLPKPWIAESWTIADGGKTLTFKIRQGIKFTDGTPLDAAAVKANFDRVLDPKTASPLKAFFGSLQSVDAPDATTAIFHFASPYAAFFTNASIAYGGISSPTAVKKYGDQYGRNPVGSGPFMFKTWTTGQSIELVRNPNYVNYRTDVDNKGVAYLDGVTFQIIADPNTQLASLQRGSTDIVSPVQAESADAVGKDPNLNLLEIKTSSQLIFLNFADKAPLDDVALRKAISYAVDRKAIVDNAGNGLISANTAPLPNGVAGYDPSLNPYPFDVEKAKQTLKDGGWVAGSDGIVAKNGKPASFTLLTFSGDSTLKRTTEVLQAQMKEIGIDLKISILEISAVVPLLAKGDYDITMVGIGWPDTSFLSLSYLSKGGAIFTARSEDADTDALITKSDQTLDPTARLEAAKQAEKAILDKVKIVPLYSPYVLIGVQKKVVGFKLDPLQNVLLNDVTIAS
jgi:peptide/nickel transport system substrate-binding protein